VGYLCMEVYLEKGGRIESKYMLLEFQESEGEGRAKESVNFLKPNNQKFYSNNWEPINERILLDSEEENNYNN
jgi:hypothetical protein